MGGLFVRSGEGLGASIIELRSGNLTVSSAEAENAFRIDLSWNRGRRTFCRIEYQASRIAVFHAYRKRREEML